MKLTAITDFLYKTVKKKRRMNDFQSKAVSERCFLSLSLSKGSKDFVIYDISLGDRK